MTEPQMRKIARWAFAQIRNSHYLWRLTVIFMNLYYLGTRLIEWLLFFFFLFSRNEYIYIQYNLYTASILKYGNSFQCLSKIFQAKRCQSWQVNFWFNMCWYSFLRGAMQITVFNWVYAIFCIRDVIKGHFYISEKRTTLVNFNECLFVFLR